MGRLRVVYDCVQLTLEKHPQLFTWIIVAAPGFTLSSMKHRENLALLFSYLLLVQDVSARDYWWMEGWDKLGITKSLEDEAFPIDIPITTIHHPNDEKEWVEYNPSSGVVHVYGPDRTNVAPYMTIQGPGKITHGVTQIPYADPRMPVIPEDEQPNIKFKDYVPPEPEIQPSSVDYSIPPDDLPLPDLSANKETRIAGWSVPGVTKSLEDQEFPIKLPLSVIYHQDEQNYEIVRPSERAVHVYGPNKPTNLNPHVTIHSPYKSTFTRNEIPYADPEMPVIPDNEQPNINFTDHVPPEPEIQPSSVDDSKPPGDLPTPADGIWNVLTKFWDDTATRGSDYANMALEKAMTTEGMIVIITSILVGIAAWNYKAILRHAKEAARSLGSFIKSSVFGVKSSFIDKIAPLITLANIALIKDGIVPISKDFGGQIVMWLKSGYKMTRDELINVIRQLVGANRLHDLGMLIQTFLSFVTDDLIVQVPSADLKKQTVTTVADKTIPIDVVKKTVEIISERNISPSDGSNTVITALTSTGNEYNITSVDIVPDRPAQKGTLIGANSNIDLVESKVAKYQESGLATVVFRGADDERYLELTEGLEKKTAELSLSHIVTPSVPVNHVFNFLNVSGHKHDPVIIKGIKTQSKQYSILYQAEMSFTLREHIGITPQEDEKVSPRFIKFYRAMLHAYFPRDPTTLKPENQSKLRNNAQQLFEDYWMHEGKKIKKQPLLHMKLMEIYLKKGLCLIPNPPQFETCKHAIKYFCELVKDDYKHIEESTTPRLLFTSNIKPATVGKTLYPYLRAAETDLSIFAVALRHIAPIPRLLDSFKPLKGKGANHLIKEYRALMVPNDKEPCTIEKTTNILEVDDEATMLYKDFMPEEKVAFVKGMIYLKFNVHPDDLPPLTFYDAGLGESINKHMEAYCKLHGGRMPIAIAP